MIKGLKFFFKELIGKYSFKFLRQDNISYQYYRILEHVTKNFKTFEVLFGNYKKCNFISLNQEKPEIYRNKNFFTNFNKLLIILGIYEEEIQEKLLFLINKYKIKYFTDIGAGIGFHFIGILKNIKNIKGYAFEEDKENLKHLRINCSENLLGKNYEIYSKFEKNIFEKVSLPIENNLIYMDIDGGEFSIINEDFLKKFKNCIIFIEYHPFTVLDEEKKKVIEFEKTIHTYHNIEKFSYKLNFTSKNFLDSLNYLKNKFKYYRYLVALSERNNNTDFLILFPKKI